MFYFRLDAVRRDIDKDPEANPHGILADGEVALLAQRFGQTIQPALQALHALGAHLDDRVHDDRELEAAHAVFIDQLSGEDIQTVLANLATTLESP